MATALKHPRRKRGSQGGPPPSSRARAAALVAAAVAVLLLAATLAAALSGSGPFAGDDAADAASDRLPPGWIGLEPLLPLAPGLKEMSALKQSAGRGASRVLAARDSGEGALRLRALPPVGAAAGPSRVAPTANPRLGRLRPAGLGALGPVDRIVGARRLLGRPPSIGDLGAIIDRELGGLPDGTVDGVVQIPPIDPLPNGIPRVVIPPIDPIPGVGTPPNGTPLPGIPTPGTPLPGIPVPGSGGVDPLPGGAPLVRPPRPVPPINLTLGDLRTDPRFDVLLISRGRRVLERYAFRDDDISGLSAQINLRSRLLAAEPIGDGGGPLARVAATPLVGAAAAGDGRVAGATAGRLRKAGLGVPGDRRPRGGASAPGGRSGAATGGRRANATRRGSRVGSRKAGGPSSGGSANGSSPGRARRGSRSVAPSRGRSRPNRRGGGSSPRGQGRHRGRGRTSPGGHGHSKPKKHRGSSRGSHGGRGGGDDHDDGDDD